MDENTRHPRGGHESSDVNIWAIGKFGIALIVLTILSVGLLIGVFRYLQSRSPEGAAVNPEQAFPQPRLQKDPIIDLKEYREAEHKALNSYGWVDRQTGVAHIPIDQAIDLVAAKGLPARQTAPVVRAVSMPTESGPGLVSSPESEAKPHEEHHQGHEGHSK